MAKPAIRPQKNIARSEAISTTKAWLTFDLMTPTFGSLSTSAVSPLVRVTTTMGSTQKLLGSGAVTYLRALV